MQCSAADAAVYANATAWTALVTSCGNTCGTQMFVGPACAVQCLHDNSLNSLSANCAVCAGNHSYCTVQNCLLQWCVADSSSPGCISCSDAACGEAFLACSGLARPPPPPPPLSAPPPIVGAPPSAPPPTPPPSPSDLLDPPFGSSNSTACNDADSKLYANTTGWVGFSLECGLTCGVGALLAGPTCVAACLRGAYLSIGCADCAAEHAHCSITHCLSECAANPNTPGCFECGDDNCLDEFLICSRLGAAHLTHVENRQGYPALPPLPPLPPPPSPPPPLAPPALPPPPPPPTIDRVIAPWLGLGVGVALGLCLGFAAIRAWCKMRSEAERLMLQQQAVVIAATTTTHLDYKL